MDFTEETATDAVRASYAGTPDPRLAAVVDALIRHLHAFVAEIEPTTAEWEQAVDFLTAVGQKCDDTRQEFVMLSDVLGVSMLVEAINARRAGGGGAPGDGPAGGAGGGAPADGGGAPTAGDGPTASTVLGPFHVVASPPLPLGASIDLAGGRVPCVVTGSVRSATGAALAGAEIDVWQCDEDGFYDVQKPGVIPAGNGRGLFRADDGGRFWFRTVVPSHYPIPTDGPVGDLLGATGRHPYRPAHIHLIVRAAGHVPLTTHAFVAGSAYIDSDAVFAVNQRLVTDFVEVDDADAAAGYATTAPFRLAQVDLVLRPEPARS